MSVRLVFVNREWLGANRELERERQRYLGNGRCYNCDGPVDPGEGCSVLAGMLMCAKCCGIGPDDFDDDLPPPPEAA